MKVTEMQQSKFRDFRRHLRNWYTERSKDVDNKLSSLEHPNEIWVRHTYNANEVPQRVLTPRSGE